MKDIAEKTELLAKERWGRELGELKHRTKNSVSSMEVGEDEEDKEEDDEAKKIKQLYGKFNAYVSQVPVLGFNSAKYDLNLIKTKLAKHLGLHQEEYCSTIKKNNAYACISTEKLKFLDVSHFFGAWYFLCKILNSLSSR